MRDPVISVLTHLVEVCRNGEEGFREAAGVVKDSHLANIFMELSEQREQFATQLRYEISRRGEKPNDRGSLAGTLHRRWMDVRSVVTSDNERAVLSECARGDQQALRTYGKALERPLPRDVHRLIENQYAQIRAAYERLQHLELRLGQQPVF